MSLGVTYSEGIWTFQVASNSACRIELILFEAEDTKHPVQRIPLERSSTGIFSVSIREDLDGFLYGYQVQDSSKKIFLDPYALEIGAEYSAITSEPALGLLRFPASFDWEKVKKPKIPYEKTVIYEGHVKGLTKLHSSVPEQERGTFLGLTSPEFISHLKKLGVTSLELLPICYHLDEAFLVEAGLTNYWGYNPINYFALSPRFAVKNSPLTINHQFKTAVRELHRAGIEVILDVVFNHTGEGPVEGGNAVSLRGLDSQTYYRGTAVSDIDYTGCGNTLNTDNPRVVRLICDSLRYFAEEMQVDGFRFDLASAISRTGDRFNQNHPLLVAIYQDPILTEVKLISEPWDATAEGYQLGGFPPEWQEWNDKYRDSVRRFWRGDGRTLGSFASSLAGSSDTFVGHHSRSINFVTAHDGFTLRDLVSYEEKHNEANAQNGQDGTNANYSSNYGDEGETEDKKIKKLRVQLQKNFLATLLLSKGVPMLLGGDELNRTQLGNNNAYCHDVDWNYLNWKTSTNFSDWVTELVKLRNKVSHITSSKFYLDSEVEWLTEANVPLTAFDWHSENSEPLVLKIKQALDGKDLILAFNPTDQPIRLDFPEMNLIISSAKILNKDPAILPEKSFAAFSKDE